MLDPTALLAKLIHKVLNRSTHYMLKDAERSNGILAAKFLSHKGISKAGGSARQPADTASFSLRAPFSVSKMRQFAIWQCTNYYNAVVKQSMQPKLYGSPNCFLSIDK